MSLKIFSTIFEVILLAKMFYMLSEHSFNANSQNAKRMIELFFGNEAFLKISIDHLSKPQHHYHHHHASSSNQQSDEKLVSSNLSAKLYLISNTLIELNSRRNSIDIPFSIIELF